MTQQEEIASTEGATPGVITSLSETAAGERLRPGPGGLPPGRVAEIQRGRILVAAVQTIEELGYARMTVARVIGRAKVSRKTFYDVFADREDCFLAVFEQVVERARARVCEAAVGQRGWRNQVRAGLARLLLFMDEERGLASLCVIDALSAGPRVLQSRARVLSELAEVLDRGRQASTAGREPPEVTAEGIVGAVFAVLHTRLVEHEDEPLLGLLGSLMSMIVLPYLGARAASNELSRPAFQVGGGEQRTSDRAPAGDGDPLAGIDMRLTRRTVGVLVAIGDHPGASSREVAESAGVADQGQISRLLTRLQRLGLVENRRGTRSQGVANAWHLTERGVEIERAVRPR